MGKSYCISSVFERLTLLCPACLKQRGRGSSGKQGREMAVCPENEKPQCSSKAAASDMYLKAHGHAPCRPACWTLLWVACRCRMCNPDWKHGGEGKAVRAKASLSHVTEKTLGKAHGEPLQRENTMFSITNPKLQPCDSLRFNEFH